MRNIKLTIAYDGTNYKGWQLQKNGRTVQEELEEAIEKIFGKHHRVNAASRTDAGVHARGQVAHFKVSSPILSQKIVMALNTVLPEDIAVIDAEDVPPDFHSRFDTKSKTYNYRILNRDLPAAINRQYAWFIRKKLDLDAMGLSVRHIIGTHDFKAFEGTGSPRSHTTRHVFKAKITKQSNGLIVFEIKADGFLRFMVRNIVGTLVDVGLGKITSDDFKEILLSKDRSRAGATAPPNGLFLIQVKY